MPPIRTRPRLEDTSTSDQLLPCSGVRVLDLGRGYAAIASMVLADFGAEVIRIEHPGEDPFRGMPAYRQWNRGKRLVLADLHEATGRARVQLLASDCDVLIENFRPQSAVRLGMDPATLSDLNPALIHLSISGFGHGGRYSNYKAYEGIVSAKCGQHVIQNGYRSDGPIYDAIFKASFGSALLGTIGVLTALHFRQSHGLGQQVSTSLVQGTAVYSYDGMRAADPSITSRMSLVQGRDPHNDSPGYRIARCADGQWIQSGSFGPGIFENLMRALGIDEYFTDPRFAKGVWSLDPPDRRVLIELIDEAYGRRPLDEWVHILTDHDAAFGQFLSTQEFMSHPQVQHNGHVIDVDDPAVGPSKQIGPLVTMRSVDWSWPGPAPDPTEGITKSDTATWAERRIGAPSVRPIKTTASPRSSALGDVTILDLAMWAAAPGGPGILADLGAQVIKIEPIAGDPTARTGGELFVRMTRSKRRVGIDLKTPEGQAVLHRLAASADVVVHNFRPGVPERLACDFDTLAKINEKLVYVYAAAFGSSGPDASRPAFDPVISAMAGGELLQAGLGNPPQQRQTADHSALLGVAAAVLLGLRQRNLTGQAQYLETTMLASAAYLFSDDFLGYEGKPERRSPDSGQYGLGPLYRLYRASDGWVFLACLRSDEWHRLCEVAEPQLAHDPRFADSEQRAAHEDELSQALAEVLARRSADEWEKLLSSSDVACVAAHRTWPHLLYDDDDSLPRGMTVQYEVPGVGQVQHTGPFVDLSATPAVIGTLEELGESTEAVLIGCGYSPAEVADLAARGVVKVGGRRAGQLR
jgi:crotonobetainyl-CoA:carnitine CoA-transferase CaiB-like acyl-CoA transferase